MWRNGNRRAVHHRRGGDHQPGQALQTGPLERLLGRAGQRQRGAAARATIRRTGWARSSWCPEPARRRKRIQLDFSLAARHLRYASKDSQNLPHTGGVGVPVRDDRRGRQVTGAWQVARDHPADPSRPRGPSASRTSNRAEGPLCRARAVLNPKRRVARGTGGPLLRPGHVGRPASYLDREPTRPEVTEIAIKVRSNKAHRQHDVVQRHLGRNHPQAAGVQWHLWVGPADPPCDLGSAGYPAQRAPTAMPLPDSKIDLATFYHYADTLTDTTRSTAPSAGPSRWRRRS